MATQTRTRTGRHAGTDWLARSSPDPTRVHRAWAETGLARIESGRRWLAAEADLLRTVDAMEHIAPDRRGPVLIHPHADRAWWLVPPGAADDLDDIPLITVHPAGWVLRCPPAHAYVDGLGWLEKPDGSGKLTDSVALGAAFGPTAGPRLSAEAFG